MKLLLPKNIILIFAILILIISCADNNIPSINIEKKSPIGWEIKEPCNIIYSDNYEDVVLSAKIKCRGGVSRRYFKHSFSLELDNKYSFCDLPYDDDWILNANYIDKTFMRHKLSYDLFRQMNIKNIASKSAYVNVKVNNKPQGLYVIMEEINAAMAGLDKNDSMAMLFKDPPIFYEQRLDYVQDSLNYYQQKYPKINKIDKTYYIEKFKDFIFNSTDTEFTKEISNWVDIANITDWHIILLFANSGDGIMKNFFLYKINSETPFRITIWDYDHSFGRDGDNELNMMERELNCSRSILLNRLMQISETGYSDKMKNRWFELRRLKIISFKNIKNHIDNNDKIIRKAIDENSEIWPIDSKWYYDNNNYNEEVDLILDFVKLRINQLDEYFNSL